MRRAARLLCLAAALCLARAAAAAAAADEASCPLGANDLRITETTGPPDFEPAFEASGAGDPRFVMFTGQPFEICMADKGRQVCQGKVFNILTEEHHQVNVEMNKFQGPDSFPYMATWMTGFGFNYRDRHYGLESTVELTMRTDVEYKVIKDDKGNFRTAHPGGDGGGFRALLSTFKVNGQSVLWRVETGKTQIMVGNMSVYFADHKHPHDPTDGPIVVIVTPDLRLTFYMESDDIWHLDFNLQIRSNHQLNKVHGILGQSMPPQWTKTNIMMLEGKMEKKYIVENGLLGSEFKYNLYQAHRTITRRRGLARKHGAPPLPHT
ncbi:MAG: hypothetical protein J3K34DRAFT_410240 [Monoraphidium minutum]|nr:MAG: hypothetical protein J3K34DRAFT_410240 [Monoraphidium minutum]